METSSIILSLSPDPAKLERRETALRKAGFEVVSVGSAGQARFEIERERCGIFLTCRLVPDIVNQDLMKLFRRYCPESGLVLFVAGDERSLIAAYEPQADIRISDSDDPEGIVEELRLRLRTQNQTERSIQ